MSRLKPLNGTIRAAIFARTMSDVEKALGLDFKRSYVVSRIVEEAIDLFAGPLGTDTMPYRWREDPAIQRMLGEIRNESSSALASSAVVLDADQAAAMLSELEVGE